MSCTEKEWHELKKLEQAGINAFLFNKITQLEHKVESLESQEVAKLYGG